MEDDDWHEIASQYPDNLHRPTPRPTLNVSRSSLGNKASLAAVHVAAVACGAYNR